MKQVFSKTIFAMLFLTCLLFAGQSLFGQNSFLITADFQVPQNQSLSNGQTITIPVSLSGQASPGTPVWMQVNYSLTFYSADPLCVVPIPFTITGPTERINDQAGLALQNHSVSFTIPSNWDLSENCFYQYCLDMEANYTSQWKLGNSIKTNLNGSHIATTSFGVSGSATHNINPAMCGAFIYDECALLQANLSTHTNKFNLTRVTVNATGGSGNYSYSWSSPFPRTGQHNYIACGCSTFTATVTDNITGCTRTISQQVCSPVDCNISHMRSAGRNLSGTISTYPNPASDFVMVQMPEQLEKAQVSLHNMSGKVVLKMPLEKTDNRIHTSGLTPGLYMIRVTQNGSPITQKKIIIQ